MFHKIYAIEKNYLLNYLDKTENFDPSKISEEKQAIFSREQAERRNEILTICADIARIQISGSLSMSGPSWIDSYFGFAGTSYTDIIEAIQEADSNEEVKKIILEMDTPGGHVDGVDSVYMAIKSAKTEVIAENHGMIASAGYWIACACDKIVAKEQTAETGSIGVIIAGLDYKEARKNFGVKLVRIVSKNAPNKAPTLEDKHGIKLLQDRVDSIERIFIERVAEGRGVSAEKVISDFGQGNVFIAMDIDTKKVDAISIGMIDELEIGGSIFNKETRDAQGGEKNIKKVIDGDEENNENKEVRETINNSKNLKQGDQMKLSEFFEKNPEAKEEFNTLVTETVSKKIAENNKSETDKAVKEAVKVKANEDIDVAKKYLAGYPESISKLAIDVIAGKLPLIALTSAASVIDSEKEKEALALAAKENKEDITPTPEGAKLSENGQIISEEDYKASIDRIKKVQGRK
jgi:signal peptide peptidase SppA